MYRTPIIQCAYLTTDKLEGYSLDDDLTHAPLAAHGVQVSMVVWHHNNINWPDYDLVVVRSAWDYHKRAEQFFDVLACIDNSTAILANPLQAQRWNARKTYLTQLGERGVATIDTLWGETLNEDKLTTLQKSFAGNQWVLKPVVGASASHTFAIDKVNIEKQRNAILESYADRAWLAQPFLHGIRDEGEYSIFYFDGELSHTVQKRPAKGDFRVQEEFGGAIELVSASEEMISTAAKVLSQIPGGCLYVRIDLARDNRGCLCVMEVELIEPALYFRMSKNAPENFAKALVRWLQVHRDSNS